MSLALAPGVHAVCLTPANCVMEGLDSVWGTMADRIRKAAGEAVTFLFSWWVSSSSAPVDTVAVHAAQRVATLWIAAPVAVLAILAVITWTVGTGSPAWIHDLARGLLVFGVTAAGSIPVIGALQRWMDGLSDGLLGAVPTGDVGRLLTDALTMPGVDPLQVGVWSALVFVASLVQFLVMQFRDGAVLVLTVALPIAAAGQFNRGSLMWLPKVTGWLLAFLTFKPAAALVYFTGFSLFRNPDDVQTVGSGLCVMIAAVLALPALLKLVTFAVSSPYPGGGSAMSGIATTTGLAASVAQVSARRGSAQPSAAPQPTGAPVAAAAAASSPATAAIGAATSATSAVSGAVTPPGTGSPP